MPQNSVVKPHVVIIGAGLGGIACAISIKKQLGFTNFITSLTAMAVKMYEKGAGYGGTWRENTYPGSASDTPTHWYSLSTELNPHWTAVMAPQPELLAYWQGLAQKHKLHANTVFHAHVVCATWNDALREWELVVEDVTTGICTATTARAVVSATGILNEPFVPEIVGASIPPIHPVGHAKASRLRGRYQPLQCRRPILDPGYLACLHQPNIELRWGEIKEIQEDGILMEGDVDVTPFDVVILGTGFITGKYFVSVTGSNGQTLEEYHKGQGGPSAYAGGVCVPGFPNYFFIGGPNTVTGNGSAVYTHECEVWSAAPSLYTFADQTQVNYIVQLLRPLLCPPSCALRAASLTVLPTAHAAYNERLQRAMAGPEYGGCPPSWFRVGGKNVSLWPWTHAWFWWVMRRVRWQDYELQAE
ncbi:predicted protein [Postia placenta Mad-698-R]|nr:predicted protein [Postia placenta Mad-698-R]